MGGTLALHDWHAARHGRFDTVNGAEVVATYGAVGAEYARLRESAALLDLGFRGRLCVLGSDRVRFLNGQVSNDVKALPPFGGCYAVVCSARGKVEADAFIHRLPDELLLDVEPGQVAALRARLEKYLIADDVELADASDAFGLLSVQGPKAAEALAASDLGLDLPNPPLALGPVQHLEFGELHVVHQARLSGEGWEIYVSSGHLAAVADRLLSGVETVSGGLAGWAALETARIEDGIPRFGADFDATNLPPEAGLEARAISYTKGCYVGQEVMGRLRTHGRVTKRLCRLRLEPDAPALPAPHDPLRLGDKTVGRVTSVTHSPRLGAGLALGYVRREVSGTEPGLFIRNAAGDLTVRVEPLAGRHFGRR